MTIYAIVNLRTQRAYIGRSVRASRRWFEHRNNLRMGRHPSKALQADWDRDGAVWFNFVRLEELPPLATKEQAAAREKWHLASVLDPYNQSASTLSGPAPGVFHHTPEAREVMRQAVLGRRLSAETKRRISEARKGRSFPHKRGYTLSAETRARMSAARTGKKGTPESRAKQSAALKGRTFTEEWKARIRAAKAGVPWSEQRRASAAATSQRELSSGRIESIVEHRHDNAGGVSCP